MQSLVRCVACGAAALFISCSSGESTTAPAGAPGIRFLNGVDVTDTVSATLAQALIVEVRDSTGARVPTGTTVRFAGVVKSETTTTETLIAPLSSAGFATLATAQTDAAGHAAILVHLGTTAGQARLAVSVPAFGLSDTARYTIEPGAPAKVEIMPTDTGVYVGTTSKIRAAVTDRFGNLRTDPVVWTVSGSSATISPAGMFSSSSVGRFSISATAGTGTRTTSISVVPHGRIAAWQSSPTGRIVLFDFDGTNAKTLAAVTEGAGGAYLAWMPNRASIVFSSRIGGIETIQVVDTNGITRPFFTSAIPDVSRAVYPSPTADGRWLFFAAYNPECASNAESAFTYCMYRSRIDGSAPELVGTLVTTGSYWSPSPDGSRVAFASTDGGVIRMFDVATKTVSSSSTLGIFPSWSPDGTQIAFLVGGATAISLTKPDGSGLRTLRNVSLGLGPNFVPLITWSADSKYIIAPASSGGINLIDNQTGLVIPLSFIPGLSAVALR